MRAFLISLFVAQTFLLGASPVPDYPFIYVHGRAEKTVAPNKAQISFQITSFSINASDAYREQSESADKVLTFAQQLGIPENAITARPIQKRAVRKDDEKGKQLEIIGYEAERAVTIEVTNLNLFTKLIDYLYEQLRTERISASFGRTDESAILKGLTESACTNARQSAERLSAGFGKKLKGVRAISEDEFSEISEPFFSGGRRPARITKIPGGSPEILDFPVVPSTISFEKMVYAIFEIK